MNYIRDTALFLNGQSAEGYRNTLADLGYPQAPTKIICDNQCAVNIANQKVKQRRSKAIDMRYHWIRDRITQNHFVVTWKPGESNLADFFTKVHPVKHFMSMKKYFIHIPVCSSPKESASSRRSIFRKTKKLEASEGVLTPAPATAVSSPLHEGSFCLPENDIKCFGRFAPLAE
jgi:hypothetical protein